MKKLVSTAGISHMEWLQYRKQGLGGSDAGAVCGLSPYRTAMEVYHDKTTEEISEEDSEAMRQGRDLEEYVAQRFMEASGKKVRRANALFQSEEHPFMIADVDRLVVGESAGLECKTASPYLAGKWEDGQVPLHYLIQCLHYMAVTGMKAWYLAVLIFGREFKYYRIERDEETLAGLIRTEEAFWKGHVEKGILPPPDGSKLASEVIAGYYRKSGGQSIALVGFDEKLRRRQELTEQIERMECERRKIEQEVKLFLGAAETARSSQFQVSWKNVESTKVDAKRLKAEKPDIYKEYSNISSCRRFTVKAA